MTDHLDSWNARCQWVNPTIFPSLAAIIEKERSIGPVAVDSVLEFIAEPTSAEWSPRQKELLKQEMLFQERLELEKTPFDFRLRWRDADGGEHSSLILAWEMHQTWRKYRDGYPNPIAVMRDKFMGDHFGAARKVSLFMGNHSRFRQNWMVCGWFCPPKEQSSNDLLF